ncbi:hydroxysqualene dehydroxylase [Solirubrobacter soli]|uniref:hydroxysqualene dehydroxylase n=1 Tax=Solirubrobacter soli TaxID=363832 RepID=UPI0003FE46E4|nr:FAD-dependent oxidoreductase [Solirubrobacter soli]
MATKVIVIGGGVAGMTAAHELASRPGFDVVVFEQRPVAGGKARSMDAIAGVGGRRALPGEHGFRFFPGFYKHVPDTMSRIPYRHQLHGVLDNLVMSTQIQIARDDARNELVAPAHLPTSASEWEATLRFALELATQLDIPVEDQLHFVRLLSDLLSACEARRFGQYEQLSWWEFSDAEHRSPAFQKFLADGLTRSLVAARAREMSARTGGYILLQLLQDLASPAGQADRVLNGPTSDVWIDPWLNELRRIGVDFRVGCRVDAISNQGTRVTGVRVQAVDEAFAPVGAAFDATADHYIAAVPVEVLRDAIAMNPLKQVSPALAGLDRLQVRWMNGIMYYLTRDAPLIHGHTIFIDSAWALTSISQRQFWPSFNPHDMGDGTVGGILSVDISDWFAPGEFSANGKIARDCTRQEVAEEVWDQLKAGLNNGTTVLDDAMRAAWFLDPSIVYPNPSEATNLEPLLVNTAGSWDHRPPAALPEVENLFLASDYVQTYTDLATMEGANEAARRAVNAVLDAIGSDADRCRLWPLHNPGGLPFRLAREADRVLYKLCGPRLGPPRTLAVEGDQLMSDPLARLRDFLP